MDPTVVKLFEGVTAQQMPALEAKILKMVSERLTRHIGYLRAQLAVKVNSKKVPHLLFRHFAEQDPITRAAFKNYEPEYPAELRAYGSFNSSSSSDSSSSSGGTIPKMKLSKLSSAQQQQQQQQQQHSEEQLAAHDKVADAV
eukprot:5971-Heterococcus_DN1.PRE.1